VVVALVTCVMAGRVRQRSVQAQVYREADALRSTLLHLIAHNLRTPLTTIKTSLSTVLTLEQLPADSQALIAEADLECDRLNRLIENVLQFSRLEAHALRMHMEWSAIDEVVSDVLGRWPEAVANGHLYATLPAGLALAWFDFQLIAAVLENLVDNAFKHGQPPIHLSVSTDTSAITFCVEDAGNGVPIEQRNQLFDQFVSLSNSGVGLGLAVCKGIVTMHGGQIRSDFAPGHTRFCFTIPARYYLDRDPTEEEPTARAFADR